LLATIQKCDVETRNTETRQTPQIFVFRVSESKDDHEKTVDSGKEKGLEGIATSMQRALWRRTMRVIPFCIVLL
jgi:hypothetical protein